MISSRLNNLNNYNNFNYIYNRKPRPFLNTNHFNYAAAMPERPSSSSSKMEVDVADIPDVPLAKLTRLLYMNPPCMDREQTAEWLAKQQRQAESLDKCLLRPKNLLSSFAIGMGQRQMPFVKVQASLCRSHNSLDPRLIRNLTIRVANELTIHVDRYRHHKRKHSLAEPIDQWLSRMDNMNVLWMGEELWEKTFGRPIDMRVPYCVNKNCEACKLAFIGGNLVALTDIRSSLLARQRYVAKREGPEAFWHGMELLRVVQDWINTCYPRQARAQCHQQSEALAPSLFNLRVELRKAREELRLQRRREGKSYIRFHPHVPNETARGIPMPRGNKSERSEVRVRVTRAELERLARLQQRVDRPRQGYSVSAGSRASTADAYTTSSESSRPPTVRSGPRNALDLQGPTFTEDEDPVDDLAQVLENTHVQDNGSDEEQDDDANEAMSPVSLADATQPGEEPIWGWLRRGHESENENQDKAKGKAKDSASTAASTSASGENANSPWAENYRRFITEGGSGADYYEENVVTSGPSAAPGTWPEDRRPSASQLCLVPEPLRVSSNSSSSQSSRRLRQHEREPMRPLLQESSTESPSSSIAARSRGSKSQSQTQAPATGTGGRRGAVDMPPPQRQRRPRDPVKLPPQGSSSDSGQSEGPVPPIPARNPRRPSTQLQPQPGPRAPAPRQTSRLPQPVPMTHQLAPALMSSGASSKYSSSVYSDDDANSGDRQADELTLANLEGYREPPRQRVSHRPRIQQAPSSAHAPAHRAAVHSGNTSSSSSGESNLEPAPPSTTRRGAQARENEPSVASCYSAMGWGGPKERRR